MTAVSLATHVETGLAGITAGTDRVSTVHAPLEPHLPKGRVVPALLSRRGVLATAGRALVGVAACGLTTQADAAQPHPQRGGMLRFATRGDALGLDPHRHAFSPVSMPLAAITQGLIDLDHHAEPVPGIAAAWEVSHDLQTYTFRLRTGVLFHNGREVDAAAVQWNLARMQDPRIGHPLTRAALANVRETVVLDTHTVQCRLHTPSAAFLADLAYYPCNLIAPESVEQAHLHPIGCGPFKLSRWERYSVTELVRFEHYFETDAAGNSLPYLEGIIGRPRKEDQVRLTVLRTREVDLIDTMAYSDTALFHTKYAETFQTWEAPTLGTSCLLFNLDQGPFTDKRLRRAAAHAIDREAVTQAVFCGCGSSATGFYAPASPWHMAGTTPAPGYDPDHARFLLRQARAVDTEVLLLALVSFPYLQHTAEVVQAMWSEVGFKVVIELCDERLVNKKRRDRAFHAEATSCSYRWDPDGWFSRMLLSSAPSTRTSSGFKHAEVDSLIAAARRTVDRQQRLELYTRIENIVNEELPLLYLHHVTALQAGGLHLQGYQPALSGLFSTRGGGVRTAWLA